MSYLHKYGLEASVQLDPVQLEQVCFHNGWPTEHGGLGRYRHFRNYAEMVLPTVEWNPWLREQIQALCDDSTAVTNGQTRFKLVAMTGCGAAGKTFSAGFFGYLWWRVDPSVSAVILCSTTEKMLRRRVWSVIPWLHGEAYCPLRKCRNPVGILIDSRTKLIAKRGDDVHGIFGIAVADGETQKAVQNIKGIHAKRIMVIVDEAEATPEAIFEAISNLRKGCQEFIVVVLGNSVSHLDPHGQICEPEDGWNSVSVEDKEWKTKGVPKWQIDPGVCLHFDGEKSPNVIARKTLYPYLYTWENYLTAQNTPTKRETMTYWQYDRGFWPPEGLTDRIFTEQMMDKYDAQGAFEFVTRSQPVAFLDPAFGGDDCVMVFGLLGDTPRGTLALQITDHTVIPIRTTSRDETDYQIARTAIMECKKRNVEPRCFGTDAVGIGRGVHAIIAGEWSPEIQRVEGSGAPTDRPSSTADGRPAHEVYDRMSTELWWSARDLLQAGQWKGLYPDAITQMCARSYKMAGRKYCIETKKDFKLRLNRSPDDADAVIGLVEVARRNGLNISSQIAQQVDRTWDRQLRETSDFYNDTVNQPDYALADDALQLV